MTLCPGCLHALNHKTRQNWGHQVPQPVTLNVSHFDPRYGIIGLLDVRAPNQTAQSASFTYLGESAILMLRVFVE